MIKPSVNLQDLRKRIYTKAKAEQSWRFWGLFIHVSKLETLETAYAIVRKNNAAAGIGGITFEDIAAKGVKAYLMEIREELVTRTYKPTRNRKQKIPKRDGKDGVRTLSIPTIRDRVVQGALKLILEPIFESDFQWKALNGYQPGKKIHEAIQLISEAIMKNSFVAQI
jgi:RNA-directed DNA polymerase